MVTEFDQKVSNSNRSSFLDNCNLMNTMFDAMEGYSIVISDSPLEDSHSREVGVVNGHDY